MTQVLIDTKVVKNALAAVNKFCLKVQTGQAKSVETYHDLMSVGNDLRAALANAERVEPDTQRLDFMFLYDAFLSRTKTDADTIAYQLLAQDEDEDYVVLSGEDKFFPTGRAAVDAAREKAKP